MHTFLTISGFIPALRGKTSTHRDGNQLEQMWFRNLSITNAIVADQIDQVSDHNLIQVKLEATCIEWVERVQTQMGEVDIRTLP